MGHEKTSQAPKVLKFPDGFLWGASMSAHQVEGHNHNQWTRWERANAIRLSVQAQQHFGRLPNWEKIRSVAESESNYVSGSAVDFWHKYPEDIRLAKKLGLNSLRISLEWSRIEPEVGKYDEKAIKKYSLILKCMKQEGITPIITLWHFTLPIWAADMGGFLNPKVKDRFIMFSKHMISEFSEYCDTWITFNEPEIYVENGYINATWPPQETSKYRAGRVLLSICDMHEAIYSQVKAVKPAIKIGIAKNNAYIKPAPFSIANWIHTKFVNWKRNHELLGKIKDSLDFIGLNYYFRDHLYFGKVTNRNEKMSDLGWDVYPEGIFYVLKELKGYKKPIIITENGIADADDKQREEFVKSTLVAVHKAILDGVNVKGYLHWSLLDNFEWDKGFWPEFGLIKVKRDTQERIIRKSAEYYRTIAETNSLVEENEEKAQKEGEKVTEVQKSKS